MEVQLNNGVLMPSPGFGTGAIRGWQEDNDEVAEVITEAIQVGYRHLDTASIYGNERSVGRAIKEIAEQQEVAPAQVILRWNLQHGWVPLPKSENSGRMQQNIHLEGFALSEVEMARIDALDRRERFNLDPEAAIEANMKMAVPE